MLEQMLAYWPCTTFIGEPLTLQEPDICWHGYSILLKAPLTHLAEVHEGCLGIRTLWARGL